jgi:uncharacterized phage protein gp47/JayE
MSIGVTPEGFVRPTFEQLRQEIVEAVLADFPGENTEVGLLGILIDIQAEKASQAWEALEATYHAAYPSSAQGMALREVSAITGTVPRDATHSIVTATVNVDPGTYSAGQLVAHVDGNPDARFSNRDEVVNGGGSATDVDAIFEAEEAGAVAAPSGSLTEIAEPVSGWNTVTNAADAVQGREADTEEDLRIRREDELAARGTTPLDALRAQLSQLEGMIQVRAFENVTDATDGDGLPPHSVEMVVWDGTTEAPHDVADADIAQAIWDGKAGGIRAHGEESVDVEASDGTEHAIGFTRAEGLDVWMELDVDTDPDTYAGDAAVKAALVEVAQDRQRIGDDVIALRYAAAALAVEGVQDVTELRLGFSANPTGTDNLSVGDRQVAVFATGRITVDQPIS